MRNIREEEHRKPDSLATSLDAPSATVDLATLMRIRNLELRAKVVVEGFWTGLHKSPFHGFSVEFTEYRQYSPGDDPRYLDWRLYARSDRYYVKRFEDETNLRCHVLLDASRSMGFGSLPYTKADYATTLAATLAQFLFDQRDAVGLVRFDAELRELLPARFRPGHLHRLMVALERPLEGTATDLSGVLDRIAEFVSKRGLLVLISDLLAPLERLQASLGALASRGHEVVLFQLLDPAEAAFGFDQPAVFVDLESGRELYVEPGQTRSVYLERLAAHNAAIAAVCEKLGLELHPIRSDRPLELVLFDFLHGRMRRGHSRRRGTRPTRKRW